ncbi:MAG: hypothetical protein OCC45_07465 [Desulfotalea sp.]
MDLILNFFSGIGTFFSNIFGGLFSKIASFFTYSKLDEQFKNVDISGLLANPWFLVPAVIFLVYMLWKQNFRDLIILLVLAGVWYFTGTDYAHSLTVNGEIQAEKILPVAGFGALALGFIIYLLFGRSD